MNILIKQTLGFFLIFCSLFVVNAQETEKKVENTKIQEKDIEEVVIVGYKKQRKETLTSSVAVVNGEDLKDVPSPNFHNLLQGKMAGVNVARSTGKPGELPTIRIRGLASLNGTNSPLYVIDGVIVHGTIDVPPDQMESVTVLKDAAATALYGSRGAAGVVVVTTKSGKGNSIGINFVNSYNYYNMGKFKVMNSEQQKERFMQFAENGINLAATLSALSNGTVNSLDQITEDFDWIKHATQVGKVVDANINFNSSKDGSKTYLFGGYYSEEGTVRGFKYEMLHARFNNENQINDWFKVSPKTFFKYEMTKSQEHSREYMKLPWDNPYFPDGSLKNIVDDPNIVWFSRDRGNYLYDRDLYYGKDNVFQAQGNIDFEIKLTENFSISSTNGLTYYRSDGFGYEDPETFGGRAPDKRGSTSSSVATRWTKYTNQMLRYDNQWDDDKHKLNALIAYEYMDYMYKSFGAGAKKIIPGTRVLGGAEANGIPSGTQNEYAFQSILSNAEYSYDDRYLFQASIRTDESSRFAPENRRGWFWGISGGWNIHNENFFADINTKNIIDKLKIRASYGVQGNAPTNYYVSYNLVSQQVYEDQIALIPSQLGNRDIRWESLYQTDMGFDITMLNNRLNIIFDFYNKDTKDLITSIPLSHMTGFQNKTANIGTLRNRGIDIAVDFDIIKRSDLIWNMAVNFSRNVTKFVELYQNDQITGQYIRSEGSKYLTYRLKEWAGVDEATGDPLWWKETINSDGEVQREVTNNWDQATYQVLNKTRMPDFTSGLNSAVSYKNFTFSVNAYFSIGGYVYHNARNLFDSDGTYPGYNQMVMHKDWIRWKPGDPDGTNHKATHPSLIYADTRKTREASTRYLEDATFVKIRNISLAYDVPKKLLLDNYFKSVRVYMSLDNFFRFTKFSGIDPEAGYSGEAGQGYPIPKGFTIGLNLSF